jgi:NADH:ubiquinone oxidoreductase subunit
MEDGIDIHRQIEEDKGHHRDRAVALLEEYGFRVVQHEVLLEMSLTHDGFFKRFQGTMDADLVDSDGRRWIGEWKTSKRPAIHGGVHEAFRIQPTLYQWVHHQVNGVEAVGHVMVHLYSGDTTPPKVTKKKCLSLQQKAGTTRAVIEEWAKASGRWPLQGNDLVAWERAKPTLDGIFPTWKSLDVAWLTFEDWVAHCEGRVRGMQVGYVNRGSGCVFCPYRLACERELETSEFDADVLETTCTREPPKSAETAVAA